MNLHIAQHQDGFLKIAAEPWLNHPRKPRIHLWSPHNPPAQEGTGIHDHPFQFESFIMIGGLSHSTVVAVEDPGGVTVSTHNLMTGDSGTMRVDALVCATGFVPGDIRDLLGDAASSCVFADGRPVVGRDYRLATTADTGVGVYLNGGVEATHGLSSTLLSNIAVRAGEIVDAVMARSPQPSHLS